MILSFPFNSKEQKEAKIEIEYDWAVILSMTEKLFLPRRFFVALVSYITLTSK